MVIRHFIATKALIERDGKILLLRESGAYADGVQTGRYDVPGGRNNPNETKHDGLRREVMEECGLAVQQADLFFVDDVTVNKNDEQWIIRRHYYACHIPDGDVVLSTDHDEFQWVDVDQLLDMANVIPNLKPVFEAYFNRFDVD